MTLILWGKKLIEFRAYRPIAFAGRSFETGAIRNGDMSAGVPDNPGLLESSHFDRYARTLDAQHRGQQLVG